MDRPFAVLGVDRDADEDELKRAYRERVKEAHPDHGGSVEEFQAVRTAYEHIKAGVEGTAVSPGTNRPAEDGSGTVRPATTRVTYLNYDVLTDYGWSVDDENLFEEAVDADLDETDFGEFEVNPGESLLEAAEERGYAWPFACRGGACANCAIILRAGELAMPVNHVLPDEMIERNLRLSCNAIPITDELEVIYNVKHMPELEELLLPPQPFKHAYPSD